MKKLLLALLLLNLSCSAGFAENGFMRFEFPTTVTVDSDSGNSTTNNLFQYTYSSSALDFSSEATMFYDQALEQYILLANIMTRNLRVIFLDKDYKIISNVYYPEKTDALPYSLHSINFYPSEYVSPEKLLPGKIIIETQKGSLIIDLVSKKSKFIFFSRYLFDSKNEEIPVLEIKKP